MLRTTKHELMYLVEQMVAAAMDDAEPGACSRYRERLLQAGRAAVPFILPLLRNDSAEVRLLALDVLGKTGDPSIAASIEQLVELDPDPDVQGAAAEALSRLHIRRAAATLIRALRSTDGGKRTDAVLALARLRCGDALPSLASLADELKNLGMREVEGLVRASIVYILRGIEGVGAMVGDPNTDIHVRQGAASVLHVSGDPEAVPVLLNCLVSEDEQLRSDALQSLSLLVPEIDLPQPGKMVAVTQLTAVLLSDPSSRNRMGAAGVLGALSEQHALPALERSAVTDPHESTRRWAARAMKRIRKAQTTR